MLSKGIFLIKFDRPAHELIYRVGAKFGNSQQNIYKTKCFYPNTNSFLSYDVQHKKYLNTLKYKVDLYNGFLSVHCES